ncbi:MAG: hypothetical protein PHF50_01255 [Patescibacteria group bacterium]|nr:hypothetical protein [Patescibacteria group bacterium]
MRSSRLLLAVLLAVAVSVMLSGCGRHYVMNRPDMHLAPSLEQTAQKVTVVTYAINPILDLSEGGDGRFAWTAVLWDKAGQETKLIALNLGNFSGDKRFMIIIPRSLAEVTGCRLAVVDHGGKRFYNHAGEVRQLESISGKVDIGKYKDFLLELGPNYNFVKELNVNSAEYKAIEKLYADFRIRDLEVARKYVYQKYGSNLTSEQLDRLAWDDSIVHGFLDWLGRDWKLFLMYPFMDIGSTALVAGIVKVFTLPSIWGDRIDRPGYMEYKPDAEYTAKMVLRGLKEYGSRPVIQTGQQQMPEAIRQALKGGPCAETLTYNSYNACAAKYNAQVLMENSKK